MSQSAEPEAPQVMRSVEEEIRSLIGLFDSPAFVRRGQEMEVGLARLDQRCSFARTGMLEMVHLRLRQWSAVSIGPHDWADIFVHSIAPLWDQSRAPLPTWGAVAASRARRRAVGRDLISSVLRFNRRWSAFVGQLNLQPLNQRIDQYNRYYVLEKECVVGSHRLAVRGFEPKPKLTAEFILKNHPLLLVPELLR